MSFLHIFVRIFFKNIRFNVHSSVSNVCLTICQQVNYRFSVYCETITILQTLFQSLKQKGITSAQNGNVPKIAYFYRSLPFISMFYMLPWYMSRYRAVPCPGTISFLKSVYASELFFVASLWRHFLRSDFDPFSTHYDASRPATQR